MSEKVKSKHSIKTKKCSYLAVTDDVDTKTDESDEVCECVHKKYGMSRIIQNKFGSGVNCYLRADTNDVCLIDETMNVSDVV